MGVEGVMTPPMTAPPATEPVMATMVKTSAVNDSSAHTETTETETSSSHHDDSINMDELCRRRTSIPSSFTYGGAESDASAAVAAAAASEERRWRSFDCNGTTSSAAKAASLDVLSARIQDEQNRIAAHTERLRPRKRSALLRSVARVFSSRYKEQIELRRMEMVAQVAKGNRSLMILHDMRTIVLTMDDDDDDDEQQHPGSTVPTPSSSSGRGSLTVDTNIQRMLDGLADADQVLAEDSLHHILELQTQFLQKTIEMHQDKKLSVPRAHGVAPSLVLQQFLSEFVRADGTQRVPCAMDAPTTALIRFEKIMTRYRLLKPQLKASLDQLCRDTMHSFTRTTGATSTTTSTVGVATIWDNDDARDNRRDVMRSLLRELEEAVLESAWVSDKYQPILRTFLEQHVFSRLAGACYRSMSVELDERNSLWRDQIVKARELQLDQVGLPVEIPDQENISTTSSSPSVLFARSIEAFNRMPHLVPSCVMAAFLSAIRVLYEETNALFGLTCPCISADVLLPLLVFVLSRTDLPHLHSQVFLMEQFAIDESQEGSEAAYYLACLQAAMGYITTEIGKTSNC